MSASEAADGSSPELCPSFAVICSFLERFGALLDLPEVSFPALERSLQESSAVPKLLVDLHVKLLRKIGKSVSADRWEKNLIKICQEFNTTWAWELEKKGYREMTVECKTGILKYLCECQFDDNVKFKTTINEEDPDKMRLQPIGRDKDGLMYWFQLDQDHNVRVYVEEQDDLDGSSWKCIVRNRDDLAQILGLLKTHIDPALLVKKDQEEGSSSNSPNPDNEENKKKEGAEVESQNDLSASENKENILEKDNAKREDAEATDALLEKGLKVKEELQKHSETADGTGVITGSIKEEPQDEEEKAKDLSAPSQNAEQTEDVKKKTLEETQRALKNDHQAKIPLKKRDMKLSEDFDSNSMGVRNTPVAPVKESRTCFDDSRSSAEKINGHVPHFTPSESETQEGSESLQKESTEENKLENLPLVSDESKEKKNDQTEEKMDTNESRSCAGGQMEVEKPEESCAAIAEENEEKSETSQSHEKTPEEEKPSSVSEQSEKTPGSEEVTDNKKSPNSVNMDSTEVNTSTLPEESMKDLPNKESTKDLGRDVSVKIILKDEPAKDQSMKHLSEEETSIEKSTKEFSKGALRDLPNTESSKDFAREDSLKVEPAKEESIKDLSKGETSKEGSIKTPSNEQSKKDLAEEESQKVLTEESQQSPKDSNKDHEKPDPTASMLMETEPFQSSKTEESSSHEVIKPHSGTEKPEHAEETKPHHSSADTTTEKEPTAIVSKTEKQCMSEGDKFSTNGESESIASKPSEDLDGPQVKAREQSASPKSASSDLEKSSVSDSTNLPSTPKTTEKVDGEEKCDTAETDKNENLETSKDKDEKGEAANSSEEFAVKKSEEVKATEQPNESNSSEKPSSDREHEKEPDSEKGDKEKPMEVNSEISKADITTASKKETDVPVDQNTTSSKQSKQETTSEEWDTSGDVQEKSNAARKSSKRPGRPPKKAQESQDEDKTGDEQEEMGRQEGIRMKIKIPAHKRKTELQREEVRGDSESEVTDGRCLRRSPRICRPTAKAVEIQDRRVERKQATPVSEKEKDDNEDKEDEDSVQRKPRKAEPDGQTKPKVGRRRKRQPWSRMRRKKKCSDDDDDVEESESEEEETEEDDSDEDYKVEKTKKRRRNRNRERNSSDSSTSSSEDDEPNDDPCKHCGLPNHPELKQLCDRLEEQLQNLDAVLKKKERAERRFDEFDEAIEEAIEEDIKEAEGGGAGRGKDMANITGHREKDISTILQEEGKENVRPRRTSAAQKKKRRRLNDLDSDSTVDEEESEDEFRLSNSSEDEEFVASDNEAESEAEVPSYEDSDFGSDADRPRRRQPPRRRRKPRGYSDEEELETDEEEEEEMVSFQSAESDDEDRKPKKIRADSSEEESRKRRRRLSLKRRRESEDDDDDDDSDESEEEERPVRKRVNRIDSDDSESEEEVKKSPSEKETEETVGKGPSPLDYNLVELPPTNGQSPMKSLEGLIPRPAVGVTSKNGNAPSAVSIAPNGMEIAAQDEDEDDLLGVTDLVDYVCNSEQL
ncbi:hypothetical protein cypCar_00028444 [Cyprinus carpio]|nr:hypothetical protein cypCar_00028444 [Cyprinus carpio]